MPAVSPTVGDMVPDFTANLTGGGSVANAANAANAGDPATAGDASCSATAGVAGSVTLSALRGRTLVLYFYPKDNTPGCTTEALHFRDLYPEFQAVGAEVIGVSRDSLRSHEGFRTKLALPFDLISDPNESLCVQFDVMKSKSMYGKKVRGVERSTFVIDGSGKLVKEWRNVKVPSHVDEVLQFVKTLQGTQVKHA